MPAMTMWQAYVFQEVFFPQTHSSMLSCIVEVVFPLWTKWLVTNPMPTQHLTQSQATSRFFQGLLVGDVNINDQVITPTGRNSFQNA